MNTILVVFRHVQKEKATLPVDLHRPSTSLLKALLSHTRTYEDTLCATTAFFVFSFHTANILACKCSS